MTHLPYLTHEFLPISGQIRAAPEDFRVEEIAAYEPTGQGGHLFIHFEKQSLTTPQAVTMIARALQVDPKQAGWAGLKDRHAVTTQWASFEGANAEEALKLELENIRILNAIPHQTKLRTGHSHGNRFEIWIRNVPQDRHADVELIIHKLYQLGIPNYYGEQRFGRNGNNVEQAIAWLSGQTRPPRDRFERKMLASAFQSELFNRCIAARVTKSSLGHIRLGELVQKTDTGGTFIVEDVQEAQNRSDQWALSPTGPMFGPKMRWPEHEAKQAEEMLLQESSLDESAFERLGHYAPGTRRVVRVRPNHIDFSAVNDDVRLAFDLPSGSYATALLREILKEDARASNQR